MTTKEIASELTLYTPVTGELYENNYDWEGCDAPLELYGEDLSAFAGSIQEALEREALPGEAERGLMAYYHETDGVNRKVASLAVTVEVHRGKLWGAAHCQLNEPLTHQELARLKEYVTGQYSDGFGEGFEQRPIQTSEGELYVHLWQDRGFSVRTRQEWEAARRPQTKKPPHPQRGGTSR